MKLSIGGSVHDPHDAVGRLLFTTLSMIAEFEADLTGIRTREGLAVAKAAGRLRGRSPKRSPAPDAHLMKLYLSGEEGPAGLAELFSVGRSTVYRASQRAGHRQPLARAWPAAVSVHTERVGLCTSTARGTRARSGARLAARQQSYRWSALVLTVHADELGRPVVVHEWWPAGRLGPVKADPNRRRLGPY